MVGWFKYLAARWNDWCGDRDMETAIRKHLSEHGYFGNTAKLRSVRLVAVERPGWLQVFRFDATARLRPPAEQSDEAPSAEAEYHDLYGLVRDDIRHDVCSIRVFQQESERVELFTRWSENLICLRGGHGLKGQTS